MGRRRPEVPWRAAAPEVDREVRLRLCAELGLRRSRCRWGTRGRRRRRRPGTRGRRRRRRRWGTTGSIVHAVEGDVVGTGSTASTAVVDGDAAGGGRPRQQLEPVRSRGCLRAGLATALAEPCRGPRCLAGKVGSSTAQGRWSGHRRLQGGGGRAAAVRTRTGEEARMGNLGGEYGG